MECLGPQCASMILEWIRTQSIGADSAPAQGTLWASSPYQEDAPAIRTRSELLGAIEHLEYAVFRRYQNQLTRANAHGSTIRSTMRFSRSSGILEDCPALSAMILEQQCRALRDAVVSGRERVERMKMQAKRADLKLAQLASLTPEGFEEFVAEIFEALGYDVERLGGTGDEGADLRAVKKGLCAVVQCKYHSQGVVGSPGASEVLGHDSSHEKSQRVFCHDAARSRSPPKSSRRIIRSSWSTVLDWSSSFRTSWGRASRKDVEPMFF